MTISNNRNNLFCGPQGYMFKAFGKSTINTFDLLPFNISRIILLHSGRTAINQAIMTLGLKSGIVAIRWWFKYHREIFWKDYPEARFLKDNLMVLPIHQRLTIEHMEFISEVFKNKIEIN